jgi:hypothetical protein
VPALSVTGRAGGSPTPAACENASIFLVEAEAAESRLPARYPDEGEH